MAKGDYRKNFSGPTQALLRLLTNIFLDSALDVRHKHMFGHVAFVLGGRTFLLVGEWPRQKRGDLVSPRPAGAGGADVTTAIFPAVDPDDERDLLSRRGSGYFAPGGTRLKSWVSLSGEWLLSEEKLAPLVNRQLGRFRDLPAKKLKNPGVCI